MATVEATRRAAAMESDVATLMDSFEGLLACAQVSDPARGEQERLQLQAHAARLAESATLLMRLAESLKRDAALSDYEGAAAAADAASDELRRRTQAALARLRARARAAPSAAASGGRHNACCVLIGERVVELDADADVEHGADVDHALLRVAAM